MREKEAARFSSTLFSNVAFSLLLFSPSFALVSDTIRFELLDGTNTIFAAFERETQECLCNQTQKIEPTK